jgi:hypothetical protein
MSEVVGNPDLDSPQPPQSAQSAPAAAEPDQTNGAPRRWTVAELSFPALLPAETGASAAAASTGV